MDQIILRVTGMHCAGCASRLQHALGRVDGVRRATADHQSGAVRVAFDPARTTVQALRGCIEQAGYGVAGQAEAAS